MKTTLYLYFNHCIFNFQLLYNYILTEKPLLAWRDACISVISHIPVPPHLELELPLAITPQPSIPFFYSKQFLTIMAVLPHQLLALVALAPWPAPLSWQGICAPHLLLNIPIIILPMLDFYLMLLGKMLRQMLNSDDKRKLFKGQFFSRKIVNTLGLLVKLTCRLLTISIPQS